MKKIYFSIVFVFTILLSTNAQFVDDMESYTTGQRIYFDHWLGNCGGGDCGIIASSEEARSGSLSGLIPGDITTDAILDLGNKIFGEWKLHFWMFVPTDREAFWTIQGSVPTNCEGWYVGFFFFNRDNVNPGQGYIDWCTPDPSDDTYFSFPHDQWFKVAMCVDISLGIENATWQLEVNDAVVVPTGTPFEDGNSSEPICLGGINFYSLTANNLYYLDDFEYANWPCDPIGVSELVKDKNVLNVFPNPVNDILNIRANKKITSVTIYNLLGKEVYSVNIDSLQSIIDMSNFVDGVYYVKAIIGDSEVTREIIK